MWINYIYNLPYDQSFSKSANISYDLNYFRLWALTLFFSPELSQISNISQPSSIYDITIINIVLSS